MHEEMASGTELTEMKSIKEGPWQIIFEGKHASLFLNGTGLCYAITIYDLDDLIIACDQARDQMESGGTK